MSFYGFMALCAVYLLAVATPDRSCRCSHPLARAWIARGSAVHRRFLLGDLLWFAGAGWAGLAALPQTAQSVFLGRALCGGRLSPVPRISALDCATSADFLEAADMHASQRPLRSFLGSLTLTLGNPEPMIFFVALLPAVVDSGRSLSLSQGLPSHRPGYLGVILPLVLGGYAWAATRARRSVPASRVRIGCSIAGREPQWPALPSPSPSSNREV